MTQREEKFEAMLAFVQERYNTAAEKMALLKAQGKEKSATYRQYMGDKLLYGNMLDLYRLHGLIP